MHYPELTISIRCSALDLKADTGRWGYIHRSRKRLSSPITMHVPTDSLYAIRIVRSHTTRKFQIEVSTRRYLMVYRHTEATFWFEQGAAPKIKMPIFHTKYIASWVSFNVIFYYCFIPV